MPVYKYVPSRSSLLSKFIVRSFFAIIEEPSSIHNSFAVHESSCRTILVAQHLNMPNSGSLAAMNNSPSTRLLTTIEDPSYICPLPAVSGSFHPAVLTVQHLVVPKRSSHQRSEAENNGNVKCSCVCEFPTPEGPARGVARENRLWPPDKHRLRVRFLDGDEKEMKTVQEIVELHYHGTPMRLRFEFLGKEDVGSADILLKFNSWSWSYVGCNAAGTDPGAPTTWLNMYNSLTNCDIRDLRRRADILHEFGHALGMEHEHQYPHCQADWKYGVLGLTQKWDQKTVESNYKRLDTSDRNVVFTGYDPKSIMHYPVDPGDTNNGVPYVPFDTVLSDGDKKFLMCHYASDSISEPKSSPKLSPKPERKLKLKPITPKTKNR
jgi:hypothetical protein